MHNRSPSSLRIISILLIFYSFGTFGLTNLLAARTLVQAIAVLVATFILINFKGKYNSKHTQILIIFTLIAAIVGIKNGAQIEKINDLFIILIGAMLITSSRDETIIAVTKTLVNCTFIICIFLLIAYVGYIILPEQRYLANKDIYDSTTGSSAVTPKNIFDWFSFTSGDGFAIGETAQMRLKGYAPEPSATVVHYLAPAALAFLLGKRATYIGLYILATNIIIITSLLSLFILAGTIVSFVLMKISRNKKRRTSVILIMIACTYIIARYDLVEILLLLGLTVNEIFGIDLILRKIGENMYEGSAFERISGIKESWIMLALSPLGYSMTALGPGAGLLASLGATSGWLGIGIFVTYIMKMLRKISLYCIHAQVQRERWALAMIFSILGFAIFISGYGWDRPSGILLLILMYRVISIKFKELTIK